MIQKIYTDLIFRGKQRGIKIRALVDTGATISVIPDHIARLMVYNRTPYTVFLRGFIKTIQASTSPIVIADTYFPAVRKRGRFTYAVVHGADQILIGMNILSVSGIYISTRTGELSVRNETWEAFKTLSGLVALGGIGYFLYKEAKHK